MPTTLPSATASTSRAVAGVVMHVGEITVDEPALFVQSHPVDGETLRVVEGAINASTEPR